jgi:hypothetical protein
MDSLEHWIFQLKKIKMKKKIKIYKINNPKNNQKKYKLKAALSVLIIEADY